MITWIKKSMTSSRKPDKMMTSLSMMKATATRIKAERFGSTMMMSTVVPGKKEPQRRESSTR